ncbi:MAG TPA: NAD(P)/FAD-dependent oxidoreductase [Aestuariivirgaceae bacterium]|nr:NAD(P)/FAD-dependent oxidoreductase [Aestuariivirgaceae bacterium]
MTAGRYAAIVIGGGHNGLVAASYLARAGKRTLLLEASDRLGGMAAEREFGPDHSAAFAPMMCPLSARIVHDLGLAAHGYGAPQPLETTSLLPDGRVLRLSPSDDATRQSIAQVSARDAEAYGPFRARMARLAGALAPFLDRTPPSLTVQSWRESWRESWSGRLGLAGFAVALRRMGRDDMRDLMRIIAMNVWDLTEEVFESPAVRGLICFDAVLGNMFGPRSPNTVFTLLHRTAQGEPGLPRGGVASLIDSLQRAARAHGVEIRTAARVARIDIAGEQVQGITLEDGQTFEADLVLSSAHPKHTLLDLAGPAHLDADFAREVRFATDRGANARVDLIVEAAPDGAVRQALARGRIVIAPDPDMLERSFDEAKYRALPSSLPLEAVSPTLLAGGTGQHLVSITLQYAPATLRDADWADHRDDLVARAIAGLEPHWPKLAKFVVAARAATPQDIAFATGSPNGHWHQIELGLHQAFMLRPVPGWAQYRTAVAGLYLCGAGTHPGGGLSGRPGANAARQALADLKRLG